MKTFLFKPFFLLLIFSFAFNSLIAQEAAKKIKPKSDPKTYIYVRHAISAELMAFAYYRDCGKQAMDEGKDEVAYNFNLVAKQELDHFNKFVDLAKKLKLNYSTDTIHMPLMSTAANLKKSVELESVEEGIYEEAGKTASKEKITNAEAAFKWAIDMGLKHKDTFSRLFEIQGK